MREAMRQGVGIICRAGRSKFDLPFATVSILSRKVDLGLLYAIACYRCKEMMFPSESMGRVHVHSASIYPPTSLLLVNTTDNNSTFEFLAG
jgi:hypothetical protein